MKRSTIINEAPLATSTRLAPLLMVFARRTRVWPLCARIAVRLEGGVLMSPTLRQLLARDRRVHLGLYSYGPLSFVCSLPPNTRIGNFCSLAANIQILRRNHPIDWVSQHPFFFNASTGVLERDAIGAVSDNPVIVGHDVWIGNGAIITPACRSIGNSAIVASGSVVAKDVSEFSIVGGVPAKIIRKRVSEDVSALISESEWWNLQLQQLRTLLPLFEGPVDRSRAEEFKSAVRALHNNPRR